MDSPAECDFTALSTDEKISHKSWKARVAGYEELYKLFSTAEETDAVFSRYADCLKSIVADANAAAQEAGLRAVQAFVDSARIANKVRGQFVSPLIEKCLASPRSGTRAKATEILLALVEADTPDMVVDELLQFVEHKQPKVVAAAINALLRINDEFGARVVNAKPILRAADKMFAHQDAAVRAEAHKLVVLIGQWLGLATIEQFISALKPLQSKEIRDAISSASARPTAARLLKRDRASAPSQPVSQPGDDVPVPTGTQPAGEPLDPYDVAEPVDLLSLIGGDFAENLNSAKWSERKEALDGLLAKMSGPRLLNGHYHELVGAVSKKLSDANIMVALSAVQVIDRLARGLRSDFIYKSAVIPGIVERLKEKKQNVVDALRSCLDALALSSPLSSVVEDFVSCSEHKNPQVRAETTGWLARTVLQSKKPLAKPEIKGICERLLKGLEDSTPEVRDASIFAFSALLKQLGEKALLPYCDKIDKIRLAKIREHSEATPILTKEPAIQTVKAEPPKPAATPKTLANPPAKDPIAPKLGVVVKPNIPSSVPKPDAPESLNLSLNPEACVEEAKQAIGEQMLNELSDPAWKVRLGAAEKLADNMPDLPAEVLLRLLEKSPGFKESNFQVFLMIIKILEKISEAESCNKAVCSHFIPVLVEKLGDLKLRSNANDLLLKLCELHSPAFVLQQATETISKLKSPKAIENALIWERAVVTDFGGIGIDVSKIVQTVKFALSNINATVRQTAIQLICTLGMYIGATARSLISDQSPAVLSLFDNEFASIKDQPKPAPVRSAASSQRQKKKVDSVLPNGSPTVEEPDQVDASDLVPRVDISDRTPTIIEGLGDANWKIRKEALDQLDDILKKTPFVVDNVHDLVPALRDRLADANKNLVSQSLELIGILGTAVGKSFSSSVAQISKNIIGCMSDNKIQVRTATLACMDALLKVSTLDCFVPSAIQSLDSENPNLRKELISWLAEQVPRAKKVEDIKALSQKINSCHSDRNADVRKAVQTYLASVSPNKDRAESEKPTDTTKKPGARAASLPGPSAPASPKKEKRSVVSKMSIVAKEQVTPKTEPTEDDGFPLSTKPREKSERSKWLFESPRKEHSISLKEQMERSVSASLLKKLFSEDFKEQMIAIGILDDYLTGKQVDESLHLNSIKAAYGNHADLLLKYFSLRIFDTNLGVLLKSCECLQHLFEMFDETEYHLTDYEASCFFGYFISQIGDSKEVVRQKMHEIVRLACRIYPASKIVGFLVEGLKNKNSRARAECLDLIAWFIDHSGVSCLNPQKMLPIVASLVADRDPTARNAAIKAVLSAESHLGNDVSSYLTDLGKKELDLIEERRKRLKTDRSKSEPEVQMSRRQSIVSQQPEAQPVVVTSNCAKKFSLELDSLHLPELSTPVLAMINSASQPEEADNSETMKPKNAERNELSMLLLDLSTPARGENALIQLDKIIGERPNIVLEHSDAVVAAHLDCIESLNGSDTRLHSHLFQSLMKLFGGQLAASVEGATMRRSLELLLRMLVGAPMPDGEALNKVLNMLVIRIIERTEKSMLFGALISLLGDSVGSLNDNTVAHSFESKFVDIQMKSLWKLTRGLAEETMDQRIFLEKIILVIHVFLSEMPPAEWKRRAASNIVHGDMPLRTIKAILHKLVSRHRASIKDYFGLVDNSDRSYCYLYCKLMLDAENGNDEQRHHEADTPAQAALTGTPAGFVPSRARGSSTAPMDESAIRAELARIFARIGNKAETREGLADLYDFRKRNPNAESLFQSFLSNTGTFFQGYVSRGLSQISAERGDGLVHKDSPVESYKQRLTQLQAQMYGMGDDVGDRKEVSAGRDRLNVQKADNVKIGAAPVDLNGLKERLARLRDANKA